MEPRLRERLRSLPKVFWGMVAGAFAVYSVLRDSVLKDLSASGSLAIVGACVLVAAVAAIVISALSRTDSERAVGALQHYAKSIEEFDAGNYAVALREALKAVEEDPTRPVHWSRVGRSALRLGQLDVAIVHFTKAIQLDTSRENKINHLHNRGIAFYLQGNYRRAERDLLDCIGMSPRSVNTLYHLAVNAFAMGDAEAACSFAQRSVFLERPAALAVQSVALYAAGRKRAARDALTQSLEAGPNTAADHYYIAAAQITLGELENGKVELRLAFQKDPKFQVWFVRDPLFSAFGDEGVRTTLVSNILASTPCASSVVNTLRISG